MFTTHERSKCDPVRAGLSRSVKHGTMAISALLAIIVISAGMLVVVTSASLASLDETRAGLDERQAFEAFTAADGCLEEALVKLNSDHAYVGENLTIGEVACTLTVTAVPGASTQRVIRAASIFEGRYTRHLEAVIDWSSKFMILSWRELTT